jgi:hypothetical protein
VVSLTIVPLVFESQPGATVLVRVAASDGFYSDSLLGLDTTEQAVSEIRVTVDIHPYDRLDDGTAPPYTLIPSFSISPEGEGNVEILLSNLLDVPVIGYHTVYVEASDAGGNIGPVSTARFEVIPTLSKNPSSSPTMFQLGTSGDDPRWLFKGTRTCDWVADKPHKRCNRRGRIGSHKVGARDACLDACMVAITLAPLADDTCADDVM